jgi:hypothetical protein
MAIELDFPSSPNVGDKYTGAAGITYQWDGTAWVIGLYSLAANFTLVGDVVDQVRVLLQDTDASSGQYRYPDDEIVANINMGMIEMYRLRPDIFLENDFKIPSFSSVNMGDSMVIEPQYVPPLVYYTVGLTQMRDDEETQDQRAGALVQRFSQILLGVT